MQSKLELQQYTADVFQGRQHWYGWYGHGCTCFGGRKSGVVWIATYVCVAFP